MMDLFDLLFLAVALAMDCFTVSMVSGAILQKKLWKVILQISFLFGFFLPVPIDPYIVPAMLLLFALSLGVMVANTQKRI